MYSRSGIISSSQDKNSQVGIGSRSQNLVDICFNISFKSSLVNIANSFNLCETFSSSSSSSSLSCVLDLFKCVSFISPITFRIFWIFQWKNSSKSLHNFSSFSFAGSIPFVFPLSNNLFMIWKDSLAAVLQLVNLF